jgi:hypothetical protein
MNRRRILALLTGSVATLSSRVASAADGDSGMPIAAKSEAIRRGGSMRGTDARPDLKLARPERQVRSVAYSRGAYRVITADGRSALFLEADLRFKIDSSDLGPEEGKPVVLPAGTEGDRAWVIFSSPDEISPFVKRRWS